MEDKKELKDHGTGSTNIYSDDDVILTFIGSRLGDDMFHVIIEFVNINESDYNYLSPVEILDIYKIKL